MKADIKDRWVNALRSGDYVQGTHCLLSESGSYCCLGVLCDLYMKESNEEMVWEATEDSNGDKMKVGSFLGYTTILPEPIMEWAGLIDQSPSVIYVDMDGDRGYFMLSNLNDDYEASFHDIAELIEEQL
jgi:hypothetical protein